MDVPNHPQKPDWGKRQVPFSRELWIERDDYTDSPPKGYFRLSPGAEVRLRYGYVVKCEGWHNGIVRCTYHPESRSGTPGADTYKVKGNIHWVSVKHAHAAQVHLYDRLFKVEHPEGVEHLNPESAKTISAQLEPSLKDAKEGQVQFERHGYFVADRGKFNRTVALRDSWAPALEKKPDTARPQVKVKQPTPLEASIAKDLRALADLLGACSTHSIVGWCFSRNLSKNNSKANGDDEQLISPLRQTLFMLAVMLSQSEPAKPNDFSEESWKQSVRILNSLFSAYLQLYFPTKGQTQGLSDEWRRSREVSMHAFLHFFNTGLMASVEQISERIRKYIAPFDGHLKARLGLSASRALEICDWISGHLQGTLDEFAELGIKEKPKRIAMLDKALKEGWSQEQLRDEVQRDDDYRVIIERFMEILTNELGKVSLTALVAQFGKDAEVFWGRFTIARGAGLKVNFPTDTSIAESKPLTLISDTHAFCTSGNSLYVALLKVSEEMLSEEDTKVPFLRHRDETLESEIAAAIRPLVGTHAKILSGACESPDGQHEHDTITVADNLCLVVEAKASPPKEPLRDPERAFPRIRDSFRSEKGLQGAFEQANRLASRIRGAESSILLFDEKGQELHRIEPNNRRRVFCVCITRDNFGGLAANLSLLLQKEDSDEYPWAVNILDLQNLAEAWTFLGWGAKEFIAFLDQRIQLHGKVVADDELDYAGYFIRHGGFDSILKSKADLMQLNPNYSSLFDEIYRHVHLGGPPPKLDIVRPVLTDLRRSLASDQPVFIDENGMPQKAAKIGRNELCPCGSGKKYKRCHGAS